MLSYLYSRRGLGIRPGLGTTLALLERLGNPHRDFSSVLIAGTNGKGSVAAMLHSILVESGYQAGLYTSPHLLDFRERIRVNRSVISEEDLAEAVRKVRSAAAGLEPTFFEVATATALLHFSTAAVDIAVVEVGMGGRWDATNCLCPEISVITPIAVDHADFLGDSLDKIVLEKAGIVREKGLLFTSHQEDGPMQALRRVCRERSAEMVDISRKFDTEIFSMNLTGSLFNLKFSHGGLGQIKTPLAGRHQVTNAVLATGSALRLRERGWSRISEGSIRSGAENTVWRGRLDTVSQYPRVVLDVAHNPASARVLVEALRELFEFSRLIFVLGIRGTKDGRLIVQELAEMSDGVLAVNTGADDAIKPEEIVHLFHEQGKNAETAGNFQEAFATAKRLAAENGLVCVTGSFGVVAEACRILGIRV